jgi:prepilin-type N-terminal cleavage/methylation domain-containing protein
LAALIAGVFVLIFKDQGPGADSPATTISLGPVVLKDCPIALFHQKLPEIEKLYREVMGAVARSGFSLVEIAIVLVIAALLLSGLLPLMSAQRTNAAISATRNKGEAIVTALMSFVARNHRLPCPAIATLPRIPVATASKQQLRARARGQRFSARARTSSVEA